MKKFLITLCAIMLVLGLTHMPRFGSAYATTQDYYDVIDIIRYNESTYILDTGDSTGETGHAIYSIESGDVIGGYGYEDNQLAFPKLFALSVDRVYVYTSNNYVQDNYVVKVLTYDNEYITTLDRYIDTNNQLKPIGANISSMATDVFGNLYMIDLSQDVILRLDANNASTLAQYDVDGVTLLPSSKVIADILGNIYIVDSSNVYKIDTRSKAMTHFLLPDNIATDTLDIDCEGNIYSIIASDKLTINKIILSTNTTIETYEYEAPITDTYSIDKATGTIYYFDDATSTVKTFNPKYDEDNIIPSIDNFTLPVSYLDNTAVEAAIAVAQAKSNIVGYKYPYFVSPNIELTQGAQVYILQALDDFYACIVTNQESYNVITYIYKNSLRLINIPAKEETKIISTHTTIAYKYPSSLATSESVTTPIKTDLTLPYGTEVSITRDLSNYPDTYGTRFYEIKVDDEYYYINIACITDSAAPLTANIKTNAKTTITDDSTGIKLYILNQEEFVDSGIIIPKDAEINVVEYNKNKEYQHINYVDEEDNYYDGYILTKYVKMNGVEIGIIVAIVLIVICFILTIVVLTTSKKNR